MESESNFSDQENLEKENPAETWDRTQLLRHISELKTRQSMWETIGERVLSASRALPPIPQYSAPYAHSLKALQEEEWALLLSDVQAGQRTGAKATGFLGGFNSKVLLQEIDYLRASLEDIRLYHQANPVRTIRVFFLGDIMDGSTIFAGQQRAIDQTTVEQVLFVVEHFSQFCAWLSGLFERVKIYGVVGNHGRIGRKGENDPMDNLDYLAYRWIQDRLKAHERVTFEPADTWFQIVQVLGWNFLLVHGDDIKAWMNIPFYGALRAEGNWHRMLRTASGSPEDDFSEEAPQLVESDGRGATADFDYMCIGHHHTKAHFGNVIMNGCWPGGSEFSLKTIMAGGFATQKLFAVAASRGITWVRDVQLRPFRPSAVKIYE